MIEPKTNDWPIVYREIHLLGGAFLVNAPEDPKSVILYPHTLDKKQAVFKIDDFKKLYRVVDKCNLGKIVGVDFIHHAHQIEGKMPIEWRFCNTYNNMSWANIEACWTWSNIGNEAYTQQNGHLWDLSKRISHQATLLNQTLRELSLAYRNQLFSIVESFKPDNKFINGFSDDIYAKFQHFLYDACVLRDYISEFVFHYVVPSHLKGGILNMNTTSKIFNKFFKERTNLTEYELFYKEICNKNGWVNKLGIYRDLVMHACPIAISNKRNYIRTTTLLLPNDQFLPLVVAPIPKSPEFIKIDRNNFKYFSDFKKQTDSFFDLSNDESSSVDILTYAISTMSDFTELLWRTISQSPLQVKILTFGPHNTKGAAIIKR
ncbi:hypothetical protein [Shewanella cutis]|uniref:Uncharacterized protein n=1 Tax=Shewanella cutis TaxID=2766780 RepID=A0ABS9QXI6_9GAMM|nr:hypothetical protein [Shewanella sp. PS-2]MCG9965083.1 hypothetical protein [Shewanella sp. PS-2]